MSARDGGPAFPVPDNVAWDESTGDAVAGMSLRDYFAGQALAGLASQPTGAETQKDIDVWTLGMSVIAYKIADDMLANRETNDE